MSGLTSGVPEQSLFSQVPLKTSVNIINQPYKIGVKDNVIYLEAHPFLVEDTETNKFHTCIIRPLRNWEKKIFFQIKNMYITKYCISALVSKLSNP